MSDNFRTGGSRPKPSSSDADTNDTPTDEPAFQTPEEVADSEKIADDHIDMSSEPTKPAQKSSKKLAMPQLSKKQWMIVGAVALILLAGFLTYWIGFRKTSQPAEPAAQKTEYTPPPAAPVVSPLTGVEVSPELAAMRVTGIMIENSPDARPQSGLNAAGVVYEAIAEGGITRFLALFQEAKPDYIGPVRSARPYYVDWVAGYDAGYAHAGGSADGLAHIRNLGVKDLDHGANAAAFQRVSSRYAPHNLYTSRDALAKAEDARGYTSSNFTGFERKKEEPVTVAPTARVIDLNISSFNYNVHYDYDQASNTYKRSVGGKPHTDERSGAQLAPKNVVVLIMPYQKSGIYSVYGNVGSGQAIFFIDGVRHEGTWEKANSKAPVVLKDSTGQPFKLNPGQTWVTAAKGGGEIISAP